MEEKAAQFDGHFEVIQTDISNFFDEFFRVMKGEIVGCVTRNFLTERESEELFLAFHSNPRTRTRSGDAHGKYLGTFHWRKRLEDYRDECVEYRKELQGFSPQWNNTIELFKAIARERGSTVRASVVEMKEVCTPLVRSWMGNQDFALVPHEDISQCFDPLQEGWEVQLGSEDVGAFSLNLCIKNDGGGDLIIWDVFPTSDERKKFGTELEGGPYPVEYVAGRRHTRISVGTGDLYAFNGALVHAVSGISGQRATISSLVRPIDTEQKEIIMWS